MAYLGENGYDTDDISITSTVPSPVLDTYPVQEILSETTAEDEDGNMIKKYLIYWEDYGLHRCTWEPEENLEDDTRILKEWRLKEKKMGTAAFNEYMDKNEEEVLQAVEDNAIVTAQRRVRRRKKRNKISIRKRNRTVLTSSDSEDDIPLRLRRLPRAQPVSSENDPPDSNSDRQEYKSLFEDNPDIIGLDTSMPPSYPEDELFVNEPPVTRRAPLVQSSSDEGGQEQPSADESGDSLRRRSRLHARNAGERLADQRSQQGTEPTLGSSLLSPKNPSETTVASRPYQPSEGGAELTARQIKPPVKIAPVAQIETNKINPHSHKSLKENSKTPKTKNALSRSIAATPKVTSEPNPVVPMRFNQDATAGFYKGIGAGTSTSTKSSAPSASDTQKKTGASAGLTSIKKTGTQFSRHMRIRLTNEPRTQVRKEWQNSEGLYNTLKFRHNAEKRSTVEKAPDPTVLEFVGPVPPGLVQQTARERFDDPYGRRETGNRHVQEAYSDAIPLQSWEVDKIPMMCSEWRLSQNCPFTPQKCKYLHRDKDERGRDYPIAKAGYVPPKYRQRPIMCPFWLRNSKGCNKSEDDCKYAHWKTDWVPDERNRDVAVPADSIQNIDFEAIARRPSQPGTVPPREKRTDNSKFTCWFWAHGNCNKGADQCKFQHHDTGIVSNPPRGYRHDNNVKQVSLDQNGHDLLDTSADPASEQSNQTHLCNSTIGDQTVDVFMEDAQASNATTPRQHALSHAGNSALPPEPQQLKPTKTHSATVAISIVKPAMADFLCLQLQQRIEEVIGIELFKLLGLGEGQQRTMPSSRVFLLFHPVEHAEELELVTRWMLMHHMKVSSPWTDGGWNHFRSQPSDEHTKSVIIVHSDFEAFPKLHGLGRAIRDGTRLWSLGIATSSDPLTASREVCTEVFPTGGFIFITDTVWEKNPQTALQIVKIYIEKLKKSLQAEDEPPLWRLCVRPELMQHIFEQLDAYDEDSDENDPDFIALADLYEIFEQKNCMAQDRAIKPSDPPDEKYPILSMRRASAEEPPLDYFNTLLRSQDEASFRMIQYYADLLINMRQQYRHFFVVHSNPEEPRAKKWLQEIQIIADVISPETCVQRLRGGNGDEFDFGSKEDE